MTRYSQEIKDRAAELYASGMPVVQIAQKMDIPRNTVRKWITEAGRVRSAEYRHSSHIKDEAIRLHSLGLSVSSVAKELDLPYNTAWNWLSPKASNKHGKNFNSEGKVLAWPQEIRNKAIELHKAGVCIATIARQLKIPYTTVWNWTSAVGLEDPSAARLAYKKSRERELGESYYERYYRKLKQDAERYLSYIKKRSEYNRKARKENPSVRIKLRLSSRIWKVLKSKSSKSTKTEELLGCKVIELISWLDSEHGADWPERDFHIDHIRPCSSFDLMVVEQQKVCFNWRNLQLLEARENCSKGGQWTIETEVKWIQRMRSMGFEGDLFLVFHDDEPSF